MKKDRQNEGDELRPEYTLSDFRKPFVRGKYANRLRESSNVVVLRPKVAEVFPNAKAVNDALSSLIDLARVTTASVRRSGSVASKQR